MLPPTTPTHPCRVPTALPQTDGTLENLTVTGPTDYGAVVQLVRPSPALWDNVMRLPAALSLHSMARQAKRDPARNSMLMTIRSALTRRHRPHPRLAQNLRRESQLGSQDPPAKLSDLSFLRVSCMGALGRCSCLVLLDYPFWE